MHLSSSVLDHRYDSRAAPRWLWHVIRRCDLPAIKAEGLLGRPHVWLTGSRRSALGCHIGKDRVLVRVQAQQLEPSLLMRSEEWQRWSNDFKRGMTHRLPPLDLLGWWARLAKFSNPEICTRLTAVLETGAYQPKALAHDIAPQLDRLKWDQLWTYQQAVPVSACSLEWDSGFYIALSSWDCVADYLDKKRSTSHGV
jgi:hypothetical protein